MLTSISSAFTVIPVPAPILSVASPDVAVPVRPAPAFTPVISPTLPVIVSVPAESSYDNDIPEPAVSNVSTLSSIASFTAAPNYRWCTLFNSSKTFLIMKFLLVIR